jgi:hypothetical protein
MAQYYQPHHDDSVVLTPVRRGAEDGDTAVYVIPVAEALPPSKTSKRLRQERGASIATLDAEDEAAWTQTLFGGCCAASPTYWLRTLLCPCATAAAVNERLGSSFELALLYFGVLASGMFVCTGLAITYDQTNRKSSRHYHGDHDGFPHDGMGGSWSDRNSSSFGSGFGGGSWPPPPNDEDDVSLGKNPEFWAGVVVACVLLFLLGVWLLRDQTRKRLSLRGTKLGDLIVSCACCCCALGQMDLELRQSKLANKRKKERRQEQQQQQQQQQVADQDAQVSTLPVVTVAPEAAVRYPRHETADTLAAYPAGALV